MSQIDSAIAEGTPVLSPFRTDPVQAHAESLEGVNVGHFVVLKDGEERCFGLVTAIDFKNHLVTLSSYEAD
jgi:hypothetical protein